MSAPIIRCLNGHSNSASFQFCGECGLSLVGVCPNGHHNPEGHLYCGECGVHLDGSFPLSAPPTTRMADREPNEAIPTVESGPVSTVLAGDSITHEHHATQPERLLSAPDGRSAGDHGLGRPVGGLWARLPKWGKVVVLAAPVLVVLLTIVNAMTSAEESTGDAESRLERAMRGDLDDRVPTNNTPPFGNSAPTLSASDLQKSLADSLATPPQSITCAGDLVGEVGQTESCEVVINDTTSVQAKITVTKVSGSDVSYDSKPSMTKAQLEKAFAAKASAQVTCDSGLDGKVGSSTTCRVTKDGTINNATVSVTEVQGLFMSLSTSRP